MGRKTTNLNNYHRQRVDIRLGGKGLVLGFIRVRVKELWG